MSKIHEVLDKVKATVGVRQHSYSDFAETMQLTAEAARAILGKNITASDICIIYVINKLVRGRNGNIKEDSILDGIAYTAIISELQDLIPDEDLPESKPRSSWYASPDD